MKILIIQSFKVNDKGIFRLLELKFRNEMWPRIMTNPTMSMLPRGYSLPTAGQFRPWFSWARPGAPGNHPPWAPSRPSGRSWAPTPELPLPLWCQASSGGDHQECSRSSSLLHLGWSTAKVSRHVSYQSRFTKLWKKKALQLYRIQLTSFTFSASSSMVNSPAARVTTI